jgi:hypothetical protein
VVKRALLVIAVGCSDPAPVFTPLVDFPTNDTASAFPLDSITVTVAHQGAEVDLLSATFSSGEAIEIPNVPYADDLVFHMTGRVGTNEVAYGRTCPFVMRADGRSPEPHIYFSRLVKFGQMELRPLAREGGVALTYNDGSGLLVGGTNPNDPTDSIEQVERYDPSTGEYETLHDIVPRIGSAIAQLGEVTDAHVVVIGGMDPATGLGANFVEVLEAKSTTDRQYEMFFEPTMARIGLTATTLADGRVVVIGGRVPPSVSAPMGMASRIVSEVSVASGIVNVRPLRAELAYARYGHTATRLADDVGAPLLIAGGLDDTGMPVGNAELYKPLSEGFSPTFMRTMVVPRSRHIAVPLPDGSALIMGGVDGNNQPVDVVELFSLDAGFVSVGTLPPNAGRVDVTATVLPDGRILVAGGRLEPGGAATTSAFVARLDSLDGTVDIVATDRLGTARAGHQATLLCDGTVLFGGGTPDQTTYERYNPPALGRR